MPPVPIQSWQGRPTPYFDPSAIVDAEEFKSHQLRRKSTIAIILTVLVCAIFAACCLAWAITMTAMYTTGGSTTSSSYLIASATAVLSSCDSSICPTASHITCTCSASRDARAGGTFASAVTSDCVDAGLSLSDCCAQLFALVGAGKTPLPSGSPVVCIDLQRGNAETISSAFGTSVNTLGTPTVGIGGVAYNGLHTTPTPVQSAVNADMTRLRTKGFTNIRTYYPQFNGGQVSVCDAAAQAGLVLAIGLFLYRGQHDDYVASDYNNYIKQGCAIVPTSAHYVVIGNEDGDSLLSLTLQYIGKANVDVLPHGVPVTSCQTTTFWLTSPNASAISSLIKVIMVNIYPSFNWSTATSDGQPINTATGVAMTPQEGLSSVQAQWQQMQAAYGKTHSIVIGEIGWPTSYGVVAQGASSWPDSAVGISNQRTFLALVSSWIQAQGITAFVYSGFDDVVGVDTSKSAFNQHFGLINVAGVDKNTYGAST